MFWQELSGDEPVEDVGPVAGRGQENEEFSFPPLTEYS